MEINSHEGANKGHEWILTVIVWFLLGCFFAVLFFFARPAHAGTVWETSGTEETAYMGSDDVTRVGFSSVTIVMPTSTFLCNVDIKLFRIRAAVAGAQAILNIYQQTGYYPTDGSLIGAYAIAESSIPLDSGTYTAYQTFTITPCPLLQQGKKYSFNFTRSPAYVSGNGYITRRRTSDQYSYTQYVTFIGGWDFTYAANREMIIRLGSLWSDVPDAGQYGITTKDFGLLGNYFRDAISYLFEPPATVLDAWKAKQTTIAGKVPWGYYTLIKTQIQTFNTSTATDLVFEFPGPFSGAATATMNITDQFAAVPANVRSWSETGFIGLVWISFLGYVWWRALHFNESPPGEI